jgi:hypothetical protein
MDVSETLFRLTTESLRLHSNETRSFSTLARLVSARAAAIGKLGHQDSDTIRSHLHAIPSNGDIRIHLDITQTSAGDLAEAKQHLGTMLGADMTLADTISILLFDYVAQQKADMILQKLGMDEAGDNRAEPTANESHEGNVIPFK